jgi:peptide deformylase
MTQTALPQGRVRTVVTDRELLKQASTPVGQVDGNILRLAADMLATMYAEEGIGLAAVQIGDLRRVIVFDVSPTRNRPEVMIDPEIVWSKKLTISMEEGCLSIPGLNVDVVRPSDVDVVYTDIDGNRRKRQLGGMHARVVQHEIDHVDGVLITDRVTTLR